MAGPIPDNGHEGDDEAAEEDEPVGQGHLVRRAFRTLHIRPVEEVREAHPPREKTTFSCIIDGYL